MAPVAQTTPDLLGALRERQAQAREIGAAYVAAVVERDSMLFWLAEAAQQAREAADRKMVHVAASADMDQSSIWRFEKRNAWPRDPDAIVAAYADDLEISTFDLWETALQLWRDDRNRPPASLNSGDGPDGHGGGPTSLEDAAGRAGEALRGGARRRKPTASKRVPKRNPRA